MKMLKKALLRDGQKLYNGGFNMVKNRNIRIVEEDAVMGKDECRKFTKTFCRGYNDFQYPFTVSFCSEGEYRVVIKGKEAVVEMVG